MILVLTGALPLPLHALSCRQQFDLDCRREDVPAKSNRPQKHWPVRIDFNLAAKPIDMDIDTAIDWTRSAHSRQGEKRLA